MNLNVPLELNKEKKSSDLPRIIDEERQMRIQLALVRVMKTENTLKYSLLIQKTIEQISAQFQPQVSLIKVNLKSKKDHVLRFVFFL